MALGVTMTMPEEDRYSMTRSQILAAIKHAMGGRAAEDLVFGQLSTGAANDLRQATDHARRMVCQYGMSDKIGPIALGDDGGDVFLGRDFVMRKEYSEKKAEEIDQEVTAILMRMYDEARQMLADHRAALDRVSEALLERETLDGPELLLLIQGLPLPALRTPVVTKPGPPPERVKAEPSKTFPGEKLPDPEPVPG
jgi:cell division protease FtsH